MAYINVAEWTTELVTDWLKGTSNGLCCLCTNKCIRVELLECLI